MGLGFGFLRSCKFLGFVFGVKDIGRFGSFWFGGELGFCGRNGGALIRFVLGLVGFWRFYLGGV